MSDSPDLLTELSTAIEASRQAEALVAVLRDALIRRDLPRSWSFSHERISEWIEDQPARYGFATHDSTRADLAPKLREAIRALPFDRSRGPLDVRAKASCLLSGESVEFWVHLEQTEPPCIRDSGHEWSAVLDDQRSPEGHPGGRRLTHGCPHCDGQKVSLWSKAGDPVAVVSYEAPHHYPEGSVRRALRAGSLEPR